MSAKDAFIAEFRKRFKKYKDLEYMNSDNGTLSAKYDNKCQKIYEEVLLWNQEWSGKEYRLTFKSELHGIISPTTHCYVFLQKNDSGCWVMPK